MGGRAQIRETLLRLGLEDWIPIPEAVASPDVRNAVGDADVVQCVSATLTDLLQEGLIRLYRGPWDGEPVELSLSDALVLLRDPAWYSFHTELPDEERLYFVNPANVR